MSLSDSDFPNKELTYKIIGACLKIHNILGSSYQEKHYQRVLEIELDALKIPFKREHEIDLEFEGKKFGKYLVDFIIDDRVVVELICLISAYFCFRVALLKLLPSNQGFTF